MSLECVLWYLPPLKPLLWDSVLNKTTRFIKHLLQGSNIGEDDRIMWSIMDSHDSVYNAKVEESTFCVTSSMCNRSQLQPLICHCYMILAIHLFKNLQPSRIVNITCDTKNTAMQEKNLSPKTQCAHKAQLWSMQLFQWNFFFLLKDESWIREVSHNRYFVTRNMGFTPPSYLNGSLAVWDCILGLMCRTQYLCYQILHLLFNPV